MKRLALYPVKLAGCFLMGAFAIVFGATLLIASPVVALFVHVNDDPQETALDPEPCRSCGRSVGVQGDDAVILCSPCFVKAAGGLEPGEERPEC